MRFLHKDFGPLQQFLTTEPCELRRLEWDLHPMEAGSFAFLPWTVKRRPAQAPQPATLADIEACFRYADRPENAGTALRHYFHVNAPASDHAVSLAGAVEHVEAFGGPAEFVLAGYPDGGIISASRRVLPFQTGAQRVDDWWGPR
jgi:hypothetical protein